MPTGFLATALHGDGTIARLTRRDGQVLPDALVGSHAPHGVFHLLPHLHGRVERRRLLHREGIVDTSAQVHLHHDVGAKLGQYFLNLLRSLLALFSPRRVKGQCKRGGIRHVPTALQVAQCPLVDDARGHDLLQRAVAVVLLFKGAIDFLNQCLCRDTFLAAALEMVVYVARLLFTQVTSEGMDVVRRDVAYVGPGQPAVLYQLVVASQIVLPHHTRQQHGGFRPHGHRTLQGFVDVVAVTHIQVVMGIVAVRHTLRPLTHL